MTWRVATGSVSPTPEMGQHVAEVVLSGWFSPGEKVAAFEKRFAEIHGVPHAIFVNSGTDALRISLAALKEYHGWKDGDEVIVPALTFVATVNTVLQVGLKPVFADVDPETYVWEQDTFKEAITDRTRAVVPVHLFGLPADMPRIKGTAKYIGLSVIEDSCESMGVGFTSQWGSETGHSKTYDSVGSFGDFGCFSTYACHLVVTGVGGLITTREKYLDELARSYANHGRDPYFLGGHAGDGKDPLELIQRRFRYFRPGFSCRVSEFEAAVGLPQLDYLAENIKKRCEISREIELSLDPGDFQVQRHPVNRGHAHMMFPIILKDDRIDRDHFCLQLEEMGIETRPLFPLLTQPVYRSMWPEEAERHPVAKRISERGFYVGCHPGMRDVDVAYLIESLKACLPRRLYAVA